VCRGSRKMRCGDRNRKKTHTHARTHMQTHTYTHYLFIQDTTENLAGCNSSKRSKKVDCFHKRSFTRIHIRGQLMRGCKCHQLHQEERSLVYYPNSMTVTISITTVTMTVATSVMVTVTIQLGPLLSPRLQLQV